MLRILIAVAAILVGSFAYAENSTASANVKIGEKLEGELGGESVHCPVPGNEHWYRGYTSNIAITLKAGQSLNISAVVVGKTRDVSLEFFDPTGKQLALNGRSVKSSMLSVEEVNVSGKYTIAIHSDLIGPFTLNTSDPAGDNDIATLEAKIKDLKAELAETEAKLKAAEAAKK